MGTGFATVIGLAFLPALGNFAGGLAAEWFPPASRWLNRALHAAAGLILAIIAIEVMPRALQSSSAYILAAAFMLGGLVYLGINSLVERWQEGKGGGAGTGAWMVYVAVAADLVGDGMLIGAGSSVSGQLGLTLAIGQVLADLPEGFAVLANFREKGIGRRNRILISASFALPVVGAAVLGYLLLRGQSEAVKMAALVFVAGLYTLAAVEDMLREAHEHAEDNNWSAFSFLAGFALFLVVSEGLGG